MIIAEWEAFTLQLPALLTVVGERGWRWHMIQFYNIYVRGYQHYNTGLWPTLLAPSQYLNYSALSKVLLLTTDMTISAVLVRMMTMMMMTSATVPPSHWWRCTPVLPVDDLTANQMSEFCHRPMRSRELYNHTFNKWLRKIYLIYFLYI